MKRLLHTLRATLTLAIVLVATAAWAQSANTINVPLSEPGSPVQLVVNGFNSTVTVTGGDVNQVTIEAVGVNTEDDRDDDRRADGLRRLTMTGTGLTVTEQNNRVHVKTQHNRAVRLDIRVPRNTSVDVKVHNGGAITVSNVRGDHEIKHHNDDVTLRNVAGSAVVATWNGEIEASFTEIAPGKPMAFTTWNGDVDLTVPAAFRADLNVESGREGVYTDFEVQMNPVPRPSTEREGTVFRVKTVDGLSGRINGGGPELRLKTYNGAIYLRKR